MKKIYFSFFFFFPSFVFSENEHTKILLENVTELRLSRGEFTSGRRGSPIPQLKCVGGSASCHFSPKDIVCTNVGSDGVDVQWKCSAEMPEKYSLGKLSVNCEGFDYPEDPFVLQGSCGLEYHLEYSEVNSPRTIDFKQILTAILIFFVVAFIISMIVEFFDLNRGPYDDDRWDLIWYINSRRCRCCRVVYLDDSHSCCESSCRRSGRSSGTTITTSIGFGNTIRR